MGYIIFYRPESFVVFYRNNGGILFLDLHDLRLNFLCISPISSIFLSKTDQQICQDPLPVM